MSPTASRSAWAVSYTHLDVYKRQTKHNGKYYFQYGATGTEFKVYADGVYVSDSTLGPFVYQKHNPMCYKPGGYVQGAGHGGTFCDVKGNYWHVRCV